MRAADLTREEEIRAHALLDTTPLPALQRVADLTARRFGAASAEVSAGGSAPVPGRRSSTPAR